MRFMPKYMFSHIAGKLLSILILISLYIPFFNIIYSSHIYAFGNNIKKGAIFEYTGSLQSYQVPSGVTSINVRVWGAGGGSVYGIGGQGGFTSATLEVNSEEYLSIMVGQAGSSGAWLHGFGGGAPRSSGKSGASGGGRSEINRSGTPLIISGGGGGAGGSSANDGTLARGGYGGGLVGQSRNYNGGGGGTQSDGGAGGSGFNAGNNGIAYLGGSGGSCEGSFCKYSTYGGWSGGGGGGGYYGGGGGGAQSDPGNGWGNAGGGGGGSSYVIPASSNVNIVQGYGTDTLRGNAGSSNSHGKIIIGNLLYNVHEDLDIIDLSNMTSVKNIPFMENVSVGIKDLRTNLIISSIGVDMSSDRDWNGITGSVDIVNGKSVVSGLTSAPGTASTHTLYIPLPSIGDSKVVRICPDATEMSGITRDCANGVNFMEGETKTVGSDSVTVTKSTVGGRQYWLADGVSGTGGMSLFSSFNLKDTLTRLEVDTLSNHTIEFGSVNGLETSGDTIEITFDPGTSAWDLSSILVSDIELDADGTPLTLGATPGVDTWGVSINTTTDSITFTAPTSGTSYIQAGTPLEVRIGDNTISGTNQITNPSTVAEYEIHIKNTYNAGSGGVETAEITIPIIDDDTVNVHGYLDTFLHFDIDTSYQEEDCDQDSGYTEPGSVGVCDSYGGANDDVGYVVSLGEMILHTVRKSGDTTLHADGGTGAVNYIWFDIETNATSGAVVTVDSLYGGLQGPGSFLIPSSDESTVNPLSGRNYGLNSISTSAGLTAEAKYDGVQGTNIGSVSQTTQTLFSSSGPVLLGRSQFEVLAYPDTTTPTGTYTDQLTFIATAGF